VFAPAVALTVLLVLESLPSAVVQLARARQGLTRLDELTRLGVLQGCHLWVLTLLGSLHLFGTVAVVAGLRTPPLGVAGAAVEALVFAWVLAMQLRSGDRGRALGAYILFLTMALSVLGMDMLR
jgi:hypothetical protein